MTATIARKKLPATVRQGHRHQVVPGNPGGDALTNTRLQFAFVELERSGALAGARSKKLQHAG